MKRIGCRIVNGVKLRLFKEGPDDGGGKRPPVLDGPPVTLKGPSARAAGTCSPGEGEPFLNLVSDEWWDKWVAQNLGVNPLLDMGHVYDIDAPDGRVAVPPQKEADHDDDAAGNV